MSAGILQLVSYGEQDIFLTYNPQITFFKAVYRRHTNFSIEQIQQSFIQTPDFGKTVTCILSQSGDLINNIIVVLKLPAIAQLYNTDGSIDNDTKIAWIRKIGYGIIDTIEIEIGGETIDKHYGKWLDIWSSLVGLKYKDLDKMIGNVKELYEYSSTKQEYTLYIPLQFWFCRSSNLALPIMCLQYNDVKINLSLSDLNACYTVSPTHYIQIQNDIVNFKPFEYIYQTVDSNNAFGIFSHYDNITKRLYYVKISNDSFLAINDENFYTSYTSLQQQQLIDKYAIHGYSSNYAAGAFINTTTTSVVATAYTRNSYKFIRIQDCFLLVDYIYLDDEERMKFYKSKHEYLIDQLIFTGNATIDGVNRSVKVGIINPCKLMVWTVQMNYLLNNRVNDIFNYTDSYIYNDTGEDPHNGNGLILNSTITFNGITRMSTQDEIYYNCVQPMQYFKYSPDKGVNIYSFGLMPDSTQPSGACNMSKIDNIQIAMKLSNIISTSNTALFSCYALTTNIFKIVSGIGGIVFTNQN